MDGNGSESVFVRTKARNVVPTVINNPSDSYTDGGKTFTPASDEYRPPVGNFTSDMSAGRWTDDPAGLHGFVEI